jgi:hypothetical protein
LGISSAWEPASLYLRIFDAGTSTLFTNGE